MCVSRDNRVAFDGKKNYALNAMRNYKNVMEELNRQEFCNDY